MFKKVYEAIRGNDTKDIEPAWVGMPSFTPHAGGHCESSAMLNALLYQGYEVNESMITGGGAALGFGFEEGTFPFLSARNGEMRELFFEGAEISWRMQIPETSDDDWSEIVTLLREETPVILRVDMRYLPYRYGGKYGSRYTSFGWHMITLFAVDEAKQRALVSDTEYAVLQEISLKDLRKARTSNTEVMPPKGEYYWVAPRPKAYSLDWDRLVRTSVKNVLRNYEQAADEDESRALIGLEGLKHYGKKLADIESYVKPRFLLPQVFAFMAGNIEEFGTGGAAFRILYRDFLEQAALNSRYEDMGRLLPLIEVCIEHWHALAQEFEDATDAIKDMSKEDKADLYQRIWELADELYRAEAAFYSEMKDLYDGWQ